MDKAWPDCERRNFTSLGHPHALLRGGSGIVDEEHLDDGVREIRQRYQRPRREAGHENAPDGARDAVPQDTTDFTGKREGIVPLVGDPLTPKHKRKACRDQQGTII